MTLCFRAVTLTQVWRDLEYEPLITGKATGVVATVSGLV